MLVQSCLQGFHINGADGLFGFTHNFLMIGGMGGGFFSANPTPNSTEPKTRETTKKYKLLFCMHIHSFFVDILGEKQGLNDPAFQVFSMISNVQKCFHDDGFFEKWILSAMDHKLPEACDHQVHDTGRRCICIGIGVIAFQVEKPPE